MKRVPAIVVAIVLFAATGFLSYRAGINRKASWGKPYTVHIGGSAESTINADRLVVHLENEKKLTLDFRRRPLDMISVYAGDFPPDSNSKSVSTLVVRPGASNVIHLSVETRQAKEHSTSPST